MPQNLNHLAVLAQILGGGQGTGAGKFGPITPDSIARKYPFEPNTATGQMAGIPGMGGGGGRGGFMARGAGQQGGMSPITQTVLGKEAEKRRQQAMKLQEKARMMEQEANELEMPKMQRPVNDTEAGIGAILMLLAGALGGGEGAAEFADGFMRSRQQGAARTDEENMRRYQQQQRSMQIGAGNEMERAKMELGEADRIEGRVDAENQRNLKLQDDEAKRKATALSSVIGRLSSDLDKAPYERIPTIISQMNEAYKALGYPEMVIPQGDIDSMVSQAKANAESALKTKAQDARTRLFRAIVPYATSEAERNKLSKWVSGMSEADLDVSLGKSEAELYQEAKRQTEDATRPGKVANLHASAQQKLSQVFLNDARRGQIEQRVAYYPQEFQLKVADTYSLIDQRSKGKVGTGENYYYGKGDETAIRSGMNSAKKTMDAIATKARNGVPVSAQEQEALKVAQADYELFSRELGKVKDAKTARVRTKYGGPEIDTSGGFAPVNPMKVDTTLPKNPAGAKTPAKSAPKSGTRTVKVGGTTVKVYPKKG